MGKKDRKIGDEKGADVGAVMTVSLFLILLTFFILLNSIAVLDQERVRAALGSLMGSFGSLPGGLSALKSGESVMPVSQPIIEQEEDLQLLMSALDKKILGRIKVDNSEERAIITISENVLFEENKPRLKSSSAPLLNKICHLIKKGVYSVDIIGHTDSSQAEEKGYRSNWELSGLMAIQILKYFVEKGRIRPERLTAYGHGDQLPIASNSTRELRIQNRRIEIVLNFKAPAYVKRIYREKPSGIFTYKNFIFKIF
jgi:chemotaxis protein MotB